MVLTHLTATDSLNSIVRYPNKAHSWCFFSNAGTWREYLETPRVPYDMMNEEDTDSDATTCDSDW